MTDILIEFGHKCRLSRDDNMWNSSKDKICDIQDQIKATKSKHNRRARKFSWLVFHRPSVVSLYKNEVYKQAKQENSTLYVVVARNSSKAKKRKKVLVSCSTEIA